MLAPAPRPDAMRWIRLVSQPSAVPLSQPSQLWRESSSCKVVKEGSPPVYSVMPYDAQSVDADAAKAASSAAGSADAQRNLVKIAEWSRKLEIADEFTFLDRKFRANQFFRDEGRRQLALHLGQSRGTFAGWPKLEQHASLFNRCSCSTPCPLMHYYRIQTEQGSYCATLGDSPLPGFEEEHAEVMQSLGATAAPVASCRACPRAPLRARLLWSIADHCPSAAEVMAKVADAKARLRAAEKSLAELQRQYDAMELDHDSPISQEAWDLSLDIENAASDVLWLRVELRETDHSSRGGTPARSLKASLDSLLSSLPRKPPSQGRALTPKLASPHLRAGSIVNGEVVWPPALDAKLLAAAEQVFVDGVTRSTKGVWPQIAEQLGGVRSAPQCAKRYRALHQKTLQPDLKTGQFSPEEDARLLELIKQHGRHFAKIAPMLGRAEQRVKDRCCNRGPFLRQLVAAGLGRPTKREGKAKAP